MVKRIIAGIVLGAILALIVLTLFFGGETFGYARGWNAAFDFLRNLGAINVPDHYVI